jgi:hypothetical protein
MNSLIIRIQNPSIDGLRKAQDAIEGLVKAYKDRFGIDLRDSHQEQSPYLAMRELEEQIVDEVEEGLYQLFSAISRTWLRTPLVKAKSDLPFKLNGRIYINPRTGKPLTNKEWEIIVHDVEKALGHIFRGSKELLVYKAMALGKILQSYPDPGVAPGLTILDIPVKLPSYLESASRFADQHAAEHITSLVANARKRIATTIIEAQRSRLGPRQLEANLFDGFASLNRDWRRVAQTELITNANNAVLATTLAEGKAEGEAHSFMIGISAPNACSWCAEHVRGKVVVALDSPPKRGDQVKIGGKMYTAIWPGKDNFGRDRADWWVSAGTQHPHCRCAWNRFMLQVASAYLMKQD